MEHLRLTSFLDALDQVLGTIQRPHQKAEDLLLLLGWRSLACSSALELLVLAPQLLDDLQCLVALSIIDATRLALVLGAFTLLGGDLLQLLLVLLLQSLHV